MRLLNVSEDGEVRLTQHWEGNIPSYAILSHTWGLAREEVSFRDMMNGLGKNKAGYDKIRFVVKQAARDALDYFWIDTCCIDRSSSMELSLAINSMFRWYHNARACYVFLADVTDHFGDPSSPPLWESEFRKSRWFTRGWTLPELIAPVSVEFFTRSGGWLGDKKTLGQQIYEITGIPMSCLRGESLSQFSVEERMSWVEQRATSEEEDIAYCLLGLFDVSMSPIYGEGRDSAFARLHSAIRRRDGAIGTAELFEKPDTITESKLTKMKQNMSAQDLKDSLDSRNIRSHSRNWEQMKGILSNLYLKEDKTLDEVMEVLHESYGFQAGKAQYERKFKQWGFRKNLRQSDWVAISRSLRRREAEGKQTVVLFNGKRIPEIKLKKEIARLFKHKFRIVSAPDLSLPEDVIVATPPPSPSTHGRSVSGFDLLDDLPWFTFQSAWIDSPVSTTRYEGQRSLPLMLFECNRTSSADGIRHSVLEIFLPDRSQKSLQAYIGTLVPERHSQVSQSLAERIFSNSEHEVVRTCLELIILLCSNNLVSNEQAYRATRSVWESATGFLVERVFSIQRPSVAAYANYVFCGAVAAEDLDIIRLITKRFLAVDLTSTSPQLGMTPLQFAAARGNHALVQVLLEAGWHPNKEVHEYLPSSVPVESFTQRNLDGWEYDTNEKFIQLCKRWLRPGYTDLEGLNEFEDSTKYHSSDVRFNAPLHARQGSAKEALQLLSHGPHITRGEDIMRMQKYGIGTNVTGVPVSGMTPLQVAVKPGRSDLVTFLLGNGANINVIPVMASGMTPLESASRYGRMDIVKLLLESGADVDLKSASGNTALQAAAGSGRTDIVKLLLDYRADITLPPAPHYGMTALQAAARSGKTEIVKLLLDRGADIKALPASHSGMTALQAAARAGSAEIVSILLDYGADINALPAQYGGLTALQAACYSGNVDTVQLLLEKNADVNAPPALESGMTAIQIAAKSGNLEIITTLLDAGARLDNPLAPDHGRILLREIAAHGYVGVLALFLENFINGEPAFVLLHLENAIEAAAGHGRLDMVYLLFKMYKVKGGDMARVKTAHTLAMKNGFNEIAKILRVGDRDEE